MSADFHGLWVALATPFNAVGDVDERAFRALVRAVVKGGVDVLVPLGTTGESSTLSDDERDAVIVACLEEAGGRPVVAGTGHNATRQTARFTARAQRLGCQGALVVTPYYNKPMPDGLVAHYAAVAEAAPDLPLVAYNVPGRTAVNVTPAVLARLWQNPQVVAIKESSQNIAQIATIARELPAGKTLLCGDDHLALAGIAVGCTGLVSVVANVLPRPLKELVDAARLGDLERARALQFELIPVMDAMFAATSPIPLKAALALTGLCEDHVRLPLTTADPAVRRQMQSALAPFLGG